MQHSERGPAVFWSTGVYRLTAQVTKLWVNIVHGHALEAFIQLVPNCTIFFVLTREVDDGKFCMELCRVSRI